jgi:general secretion pathway protein N
MRLGGWVVASLLGLALSLATIVGWAPAGVADWGLDRLTAGRLRLANASGTLWSGTGKVVLVDVGEAGGQEGDAREILQGLVLPGRFSWTVNPWPLLLGIVDARLGLDGMPQPLRLSGSFNELHGSATAMSLPAVDLGRLGSPWNTIRPSAAINLRWDDFTLRRGQFQGKMFVELRDVTSAMTPVRPLGSYKVDVASAGPQATVSLSTMSGPLLLTGSGDWEARRGLRFSAQAEAEGSERDRLQAFLALVGRRDGEKTIIKIGA